MRPTPAMAGLAAALVLCVPAQAMAGIACKPVLTFREVRFSEAQNQLRKWTGVLAVDDSRCVGTCLRLAGEDEVVDRNAATVEPHHERRHGSRGHEGAVDVADRLRGGLRHVGCGMELELDQPTPWIDLLSTCSIPVM